MYPPFQILAETPLEIFYLISNIIVILCTFIIFTVVLIDFTEFQKRNSIKKEKKSVVETGTMFLFFFFFYSLIKFRVGQLDNNIWLTTFGLLLLIVGCFVNVKGRLDLGKNWSNQIKIYTDHSFVSSGVYKFVRHPLYASIIWMFCGASLIYTNYLALLANLIIFIPFMSYRAQQEEKMLTKEFKNYKNYQIKVGMFFPKLLKIKK